VLPSPVASPAISPEQFRGEFSIFRDRRFINSCSKGPLADAVREALEEYLDGWAREGSDWELWGTWVEEARRTFAGLVGARPSEIGLTFGASGGINSAASALDFAGSRNRVVLGDLEFPTMGHIWMAQQARGAQVVRVSVHNDDPARPYLDALDEHTLILPLTHVSYRTGARLPVKELVDAAHRVGALVMLDAYQTLGTEPLDVHALGVDVLVTGCLKYLLGPPGIGFVYVREELIERLRPTISGWHAQTPEAMLDVDRLDYAPDARRFQMGTEAAHSLHAAVAGVRRLEAVGLPTIGRWIAQLTGATVAGAHERGLRVLTPEDPKRRGALVSIGVAEPAAAVAALAARGIVTSWRGEGVRLSYHYFNTLDDVTAVLDALAGCA
jgi:selenocysteine lyase/cysteine desulfurase